MWFLILFSTELIKKNIVDHERWKLYFYSLKIIRKKLRKSNHLNNTVVIYFKIKKRLVRVSLSNNFGCIINLIATFEHYIFLTNLYLSNLKFNMFFFILIF